MKTEYFGHLAAIYDDLCEEYQESHHAVGWFSKKTQYKRFEVLTDLPDLTHSRILDVGCGQGGLLDYLIQTETKVDYTGIDISAKMIHFCQNKYPKNRFFQANSLAVNERYDYIFASGILSNRTTHHLQFVETLLTHMFSIANKGISVNFLSLNAPLEEQNHHAFFYFEPETVIKLGLGLSPYIRLRHDYLPNDMTLSVFKSLREKTV